MNGIWSNGKSDPNDLTSRGIGLNVLQQNIDTTTKEGRLMFSVLDALAQFEN